MATSTLVSVIFPLAIDEVWSHLRNFLFPVKLLSSVISAGEIESGKDSFSVGAIRKLVWKSGEMCRHRLLELSDQFYVCSWELVDSGNFTQFS
jgi:hypothetical protein